MSELTLSPADFQEMLSSMLLAEMPYSSRLHHTQGASLPPTFIVTDAADKNLLVEKAESMFHGKGVLGPEHQTLGEWSAALHRHWQAGSREITFFTSGSTGKPVPRTHPLSTHVQEILALAKIFSGRSRIVGFVPRHHIYGFLFSVLLPKALDCPVLLLPPLPGKGIEKLLQQGDLVIAFPLFWGKLLEIDLNFASGIRGVTSTGPCPAATITGLQKQGLELVYEVYGSSETGGVGIRSTPGSPYRLLPHWRKSEEADSLVRVFSSGEQIAFPLQDVLQWHGSEEFLPIKRTDNAVQVAGINVYPARVESVLCEHPLVRACTVRLMRPEEGSRLKTAIVLEESACEQNAAEADIRRWAKEHLSPCECPAAYTFMSRLPANELGKRTDWN